MLLSDIHRLLFDALPRFGVEQQNIFENHEHPPCGWVIGWFLLLVPYMFFLVFEGAPYSPLRK